MDNILNFNLSKDRPLSILCREKNATTFLEVCKFIQSIPYGRNSNRSDFTLVLSELRGTCSTKHAFLSALANENGIIGIDLYIGIYKMNNDNTEGIGSILKSNNLNYIPEAHTYLKCNQINFDFTRITKNQMAFENDLLLEEKIRPKQIGSYKLELHQAYIKQWLMDNQSSFSFKDIWEIREACIQQLGS